MATITKVYPFVEALAEKKHNLGSDQLVVALTNSAPTTAMAQLSEITQITYTYCSTRNLTTASSAQSGGLYTLTLTDLILTASGGSIGPFQYVVIYNDTATNDELIGYIDYGAAVTVTDGNTFTIDFTDTNQLLTIQ
jgi:hypothetical protein